MQYELKFKIIYRKYNSSLAILCFYWS